MPLCNVCGKQNREQARFCGYCGQPLQGSPSQPAQETRKAPQVVSSARWLVWLVLGPFWFLSTGLGFTVVAIWLTTRSVPERAIFFNKLAYEVGGVGVALTAGDLSRDLDLVGQPQTAPGPLLITLGGRHHS